MTFVIYLTTKWQGVWKKRSGNTWQISLGFIQILHYPSDLIHDFAKKTKWDSMQYEWDFSCIPDVAPITKCRHLITPYGKVKVSCDIDYDNANKTVSYISPDGIISNTPIQEYGEEVYLSLQSLVKNA